ncbi:PREDICTED: transcriptional regulator Kaiso [Poecilia mexicana]|nr:PREDICTED: transcriptional regulator Kaiso [Poecilia mexicana]XP_014838273.1 PREDICTED: transcriptional regulator Kaiso [Poecilia mexicana]
MPSLKLISATDTQYSAAVLKSLNEQRSNGLFCDITIIIQDKKFRAHKTILSASSTYFHQLFAVAGQVIELNFIRPEIFEHILNYIYSSRIIRVRSDMLEELIRAGKILGVKFIANLHSPLSQVKGLSGLSQETGSKSDASTETMPVITESFSISAEEFNQTKKPGGNEEEGDDVVFVSCTDAQTRAASLKANPSDIIDLEKVESENVESKQSEDSNHVAADAGKAAATPKTNGAKCQVNSSDCSSSNSPATHAQPGSLTPGPTSESTDMLGVHKKQVAASSQEGDPKIRLLDVSGVSASSAKGTIEAKQTVTLNTGTEIDSLSSGCKVYANIGEDTYDIVQMKEDPGEGGSKPNKGKRALMATPKKAFDQTPLSPTLSPNRKKNKMELDDHYELIMDGKTFYVCAVCKRPYVCITSLRRHFNTHSWEKKYPCRFCNKVFALAEYRTKHEVCHTGERRYQCLLCNDMFQNYQVLSHHCKQVHNQDPSGRKQKDDGDNNLYRLLPCRSKKKSYVTDLSGTPLISEDGSMQEMSPAEMEAMHSSAQSGMYWDDLFTEPGAHMQPDSESPSMSSPTQGPMEFEYITP